MISVASKLFYIGPGGAENIDVRFEPTLAALGVVTLGGVKAAISEEAAGGWRGRAGLSVLSITMDRWANSFVGS